MVVHEFVCFEPVQKKSTSSASSRQFVKRLEDTIISRSEVLQNAVSAADGSPVVHLPLPFNTSGRFFDVWMKVSNVTDIDRQNALKNVSLPQLLNGLKVRARLRCWCTTTYLCVLK